MNQRLTKFFKGLNDWHITQRYSDRHKALDIIGNKVNFGYGTPLCAPENCLVLGITSEELSHNDKSLESGYGIRFKGLETGLEYLYWHTLPIFPVYGGDIVPRGQIIAYMGNAGMVYQGGKYVPLDNRLKEPYLGTHLHIQIEKDGKRVDPYPLLNFNWEPQYTLVDSISALIKVLKKISQGIK